MTVKKAVLISMILSLVIASGCITPPVKNCGSDESCFDESLRSCLPATITTLEKQEAFANLSTSYVITATVVGKEGNDCVLKERIGDIEMRGNLTEAPSRLIFVLISMADSEMLCKINGTTTLDKEGMRSILDVCTGGLKDLLVEAFGIEEGGPQIPSSKSVKIMESFCVGGEKIVGYVRNTGTEPINISGELSWVNASNGEVVPVEWKDFTGTVPTDYLIPFKMAQFNINSSPGILYSFELLFGEKSYPVSVQC